MSISDNINKQLDKGESLVQDRDAILGNFYPSLMSKTEKNNWTEKVVKANVFGNVDEGDKKAVGYLQSRGFAKQDTEDFRAGMEEFNQRTKNEEEPELD